MCEGTKQKKKNEARWSTTEPQTSPILQTSNCHSFPRMGTLRCVITICFIQQGCVKVWDIGQSSGKNPISTLECLVSHYDNPVWISASEFFYVSLGNIFLWVLDCILVVNLIQFFSPSGSSLLVINNLVWYLP